MGFAVEIHPSHDIYDLWVGDYKCGRCKMCTCHSMHKLVVECENIDGRVKKEEK